jgi:parallel beta-helix repeat protein
LCNKSIIMVIGLFLIYSMIIPHSDYVDNGILEDNSNEINLSEYSEHDPIIITSNEDLASQGWPGAGTLEDPYILSGINITETTDSILISNNLLSGGSGVHMENAENIQISSCFIYGILDTWSSSYYGYYYGTGIVASDCDKCTVSKNIIWNVRNGIHLSKGSNWDIYNNTIMNCTIQSIFSLEMEDISISNNNLSGSHSTDIDLRDYYHYGGIKIKNGDEVRINNNTVVGHAGCGIRLDYWNPLSPMTCTIYWNRIGWNGANAYDDREDTGKFWDSSERGNWWSDYDGSGSYRIDGDHAADRYPILLQDTSPPTIDILQVPQQPLESQSVMVNALIEDESGIKNASLRYSSNGWATWNELYMKFNGTYWKESIPAHAVGMSVSYKVYTIDYANNSQQSTEYTYSVVSTLPQSSATTTTSTNGDTSPFDISLMLGIGAVIGIAVVIIILIKKK